MSRIICPPREQLPALRTPLTTGEHLVLDFFDEHLPGGWEIYVQPHLNGLRPDFVLLHPAVGIAVFEVKDWDLGAIAFTVRMSGRCPVLWCRRPDGREFRRRDNPVEKVVQYKREILNLYCSGLGRRLEDCPEAAATVTAGVIMTGATTAAAEELFQPFRDHYQLLGGRKPYHPVAGSDAMDAKAVSAVFPWAVNTKSRWMTEDLAADLRTWLVEPEHAAAQRDPLPLNGRQLEVVNTRTANGYRRVRGPAGSGKSLALAGRAARLSAEGKDVLVITFNLTLWHYLRDLAVRYPEPGKSITARITWLHFHEWCKRTCAQAGLSAEYRNLWRRHFGETDDDPFAEDDAGLERLLETDLPGLVVQAVNEGGDAVPRYDAILVDEGQDFNLDWWNLLRKVRRDGGEMVLAEDATQDLYGRCRKWTDGSLRGSGLVGAPFRLEGSYRYPPAFVPYLRSFAEIYVGGNADNFPAVQGELFERMRLRWIQVGPTGDAAAALVEAVVELTRLGPEFPVAWSDVTLLLGNHDLGLRCVDSLVTLGVNVAHVFSRDRRSRKPLKQAFWMGDARLKATTVHSFKGWESRAVVMHIGDARTADDAASTYVSLSRLRRSPSGSLLTVVCSATELEPYGRTWPIFDRA